ncbi:cryptochrome/photolyase-related protein [Halobacterium hubeiense]|uniref:Cryptochrome/photolyase-related protein n=1 Tax=Halobacterium hubeiense TaxID=1407499 RepID=A0A0U5HSY8_9EURY|nr:cryptochrome/photolyase family protein [Halobacterium hubeiense]CQH53382.1 cryptochrome/photolyase-related protein [Halobacterium hubeiense]
MTAVWVLGDQLSRERGPLADDPDRVLFVEASEFARRRRYHPQKLTLVFAAMRNLADDLRADGVDVVYERADSFAAGLDAYFDAHPGDELVVQRPATHGAADRLRELVTERGGSLRVVENEQFLCSPDDFDEWADDRDGDAYSHEAFYRWMRRETGYLLTDGDPEGGEWNYDEQNRETPPDDYESAPLPEFEYGERVPEVREWVAAEFDTWGDPDGFGWPVARQHAERALDDFLDHRLAEFGPYEDAMLADDWHLDHSLLSAALNVGLLGPREVVEAAISAYREREDIPLHSVEGFVRQVVGWREFVRHVYRREMPELADANQLDQTRELPPLYWDPDATEMACVGTAVGRVHDRGYTHHIERLMVLSNFALLYGTSPQALNEWFYGGFVDAFHWVVTPNVVGMGSFGTAAFTTKPYAASANYVDRMSDFCAGCRYDPDSTTGADACPFNSLYWDFLAAREDDLRANHRMGLVYSHLDDKRDAGDLAAIRERADAVRSRAASGDL